jgi:AcrR family transcriptional regulator
MPATKQRAHPAGQAARSAAMRARLIAATRQSLMDSGYARTTAVEVCARAGVTRGALFHHFSGLSELFAVTLDEVCAQMGARSRAAFEQSDFPQGMDAYIDAVQSIFGHADFKIVIEAWLAARNDAELRVELRPVIERIKRAATPELNETLAAKVGRSAQDIAFYRLILESMIGMALGRAVAPDGKPMGHEESVVALLKELARKRDKPRLLRAK